MHAHKMASLLFKLWARLCPKQVPLSIMIVGLDNSGKTSILNAIASSNSCRIPITLATSKSQPSSSKIVDSNEYDNNSDETSTQEECHKTEKLMENFTSQSSDNKLIINDYNNNNTDNRMCANNNTSGNIMPTVGYNYERIQYKSLAITVLDFSGQNKYRGLWQEFYNGVDGIVFVIDSSDLIRLVVVRDELENLLSHPYFATLQGSNIGHQSSPSTPSPASMAFNLSSPSNQAPFFPEHQTITPISSPALAQKQLTISQGKLIQQPLDTVPLVSGCGVSGNGNGISQTAHRLRASSSGSRNARGFQASSSGRKRTKVPILFLANKADLANSASTDVIIETLDLNQLPIDRHPWLIKPTSVDQNQGIQESFEWLISQLSMNNLSKS